MLRGDASAPKFSSAFCFAFFFAHILVLFLGTATCHLYPRGRGGRPGRVARNQAVRERPLCLHSPRGSAEATKQAQLLITGLVQEPDRDLSDIMAQHGVTVGPKAPPEVPQQQQQAPPTGGRTAASGAAVAAAPCLPASAPSASQLVSVSD